MRNILFTLFLFACVVLYWCDGSLQVDEIPSEEKVVLIAKDIEVHIVFKGRAASLKKFCTTLKSTRNASLPSKGNAVSSGNPSTSSK